MDIKAGQTTIGIRQTSTAAFDGSAPEGPASKAYVAVANGTTKIIQYVDPDNRDLIALDQGGLYDFGNDQTVLLKEVRAASANGNITVVIGDRGDTDHDVTIGTAAAAHREFNDVAILPSQVLKVSTASAAAGGYIEVYVVKGDWF